MKIKSLLLIFLLSLFAAALEAQLYVDNFAQNLSVEKQTLQTADLCEEVDDDDRLFLNLEYGTLNTYELVKKIGFHNNLVKQMFPLEIYKPPVVL